MTIVTNGEMQNPSHLSENLWKTLVTLVTKVTNVEDAEPSHTLKISRNVLWHSLYSWKNQSDVLSLSISFWKSLENYCYICDNCDKWGDVKPLPIIFLKISEKFLLHLWQMWQMWKMQNPLMPLKSLKMFCDVRYICEKSECCFVALHIWKSLENYCYCIVFIIDVTKCNKKISASFQNSAPLRI